MKEQMIPAEHKKDNNSNSEGKNFATSNLTWVIGFPLLSFVSSFFVSIVCCKLWQGVTYYYQTWHQLWHGTVKLKLILDLKLYNISTTEKMCAESSKMADEKEHQLQEEISTDDVQNYKVDDILPEVHKIVMHNNI